MKTFKTAGSLRAQRRVWGNNGMSVGLVATKGSIHEGHLALVMKAGAMCDVTVVSIYVDPAQFRSKEEYEMYPRQLARDVDVLMKAGATAVYVPTREGHPSEGGVHPPGSVVVKVSPGEEGPESKRNPNYITGHLTFLAKLLNIIAPEYLFIGQISIEKCYSASLLIRSLHYSVEIVLLPTVRELNRVAICARSKSGEFPQLTALYRTLVFVAERIRTCGTSTIESSSVILAATAYFSDTCSDESFILDYVCVVGCMDLRPIPLLKKETRCIIIGAATFRGAALRDNILHNCSLSDLHAVLSDSQRDSTGAFTGN